MPDHGEQQQTMSEESIRQMLGEKFVPKDLKGNPIKVEESEQKHLEKVGGLLRNIRQKEYEDKITREMYVFREGYIVGQRDLVSRINGLTGDIRFVNIRFQEFQQQTKKGDTNMETATDSRGFKSRTEEIQYLGQMLSATTSEDVDRLNAIASRLNEIVFRESPNGYAVIGTVEPIYEHTERSVEITAFLRGFVNKYKDADLRVKDVFDYLKTLLNDGNNNSGLN